MPKHLAAPIALLFLLAAAFTAAPPATQISPDVHDFPSRGFRLEKLHLTGWIPANPASVNNVLRYAGPGSAGTHLTGVVAVDTYPVVPGPTALADVAAEVAKESAGATITPFKVDGEDALHIEAPASGPTIKLVEAVVVIHAGLSYIISGGATAGVDCHPVIQQLISSWKFEPRIEASDHLDFRPYPVTVLPGLQMNFPQDAYLRTMPDPQHDFAFQIYNARTDHGEFGAQVSIAACPPGVSFATIADGVLAKVNGAKVYDAPLIWSRRHNQPTRLITNFVHDPKASKLAPDGSSYMMIAIFQLDAGRLVSINFIANTSDDKILAKYHAVAESIVDTLTPAPAPPSAPNTKEE